MNEVDNDFGGSILAIIRPTELLPRCKRDRKVARRQRERSLIDNSDDSSERSIPQSDNGAVVRYHDLVRDQYLACHVIFASDQKQPMTEESKVVQLVTDSQICLGLRTIDHIDTVISRQSPESTIHKLAYLIVAPT